MPEFCSISDIVIVAFSLGAVFGVSCKTTIDWLKRNTRLGRRRP